MQKLDVTNELHKSTKIINIKLGFNRNNFNNTERKWNFPEIEVSRVKRTLYIKRLHVRLLLKNNDWYLNRLMIM